MHICVSKLATIGPYNGLSPCWRQAIIWTNARIMLLGPSEIIFIWILIAIHTFYSRKYIWKVVRKLAATFSQPQCVKLSFVHSISSLYSNPAKSLSSIASRPVVNRFEILHRAQQRYWRVYDEFRTDILYCTTSLVSGGDMHVVLLPKYIAKNIVLYNWYNKDTNIPCICYCLVYNSPH